MLRFLINLGTRCTAVMKSQTVTRHPQLESIREDLNRLKITWGLCCASPILYLLFSQLIQDTFFTAKQMGFANLTQNQSYLAIGLAAGVVLAMQGVMFLIRRNYH